MHECFYKKTNSTVKTVVKAVKMTYYNGWYEKNFDIIFDFEKGTISDKSYQFYNETDFTFVADLTANDTTSVNGVTFYVHTTNNDVRILQGFFNTDLGRWVAVSKFDSNSLPVNLSVEVTANTDSMEVLADTQQATDLLNDIQAFVDTSVKERNELDRIETMVDEEIEKDDADFELIKSQINEYAGFNINNGDVEKIAEDDFEQRITQIMEETNNLIKVIDNFLDDGLDDYKKYYTTNETLDDGSVMRKDVGNCDGLSVTKLMDEGYQQIPSTDGVLLFYSGDDFCEYVDFKNKIRFRYTFSQSSLARGIRKAPVPSTWSLLWDGIYNSLRNAVADRDNLNRMITEANTLRLQHLLRIDFEERECLSLLNMVEADLKKEFTFVQFNNRRTLLRQLNHVEKRRARLMRLPRNLNMAYRAVNELNEIVGIYQRLVVNYNRIHNFDVSECVQENYPKVKEILEKMHSDISRAYWDYARWRICLYATQKITDVWLGRVPLVGFVLNVLEDAAVNIRDAQFENDVPARLDVLYKNKEASEKKCLKKDDEEEDDKPEKERPKTDEEKTIPKNEAPEPPLEPITPIHDPSGFVYEAVTSNRLQDVTTAVYYQEDNEPMLWDAEDFSQVNPIVTDETGLYRWDVPQGMWKVRFEKSGYETTETEWLPVPPPQMEINIPMEQAISPVVTDVIGVESGITLTFSKYLKPETATFSNMSAEKENRVENGNTRMMNLEEDPYTGKSYASRVKFVPNKAFTAGDVVMLTVKKDVESYCGAKMTADTTLHVVIQKEVETLKVDSVVNVKYGEEAIINVSILPAEAGQGRTLRVASTSPLIAHVEQETVTIDEQGHAQVNVLGKLPGTAALNWSLDELNIKATTTVNVVTRTDQYIVRRPKATKPSGTVTKGTLVKLSCDTKEATIYYTIDGSCPCDDNESRMVYDGTPIVINKSITIKAIAMAPNMQDSEVATFTYRLMIGDVNEDGVIDVADLALTIDHILNRVKQDESALYRMDMNADGIVDVGDAILIAKTILANSGKVNAPANARGEVQPVDLSMYTAMQLNVLVPSGTKISGIRLTGANGKTHQLMYQQTGENRFIVVVFSLGNNLFNPDDCKILDVITDGDAEVETAGVLLTTPTGNRRLIGSLPEGTVTNIKKIDFSGNAIDDVYNLSGIKVLTVGESLKRLPKGVYIINGNKVIK